MREPSHFEHTSPGRRPPLAGFTSFEGAGSTPVPPQREHLPAARPGTGAVRERSCMHASQTIVEPGHRAWLWSVMFDEAHSSRSRPRIVSPAQSQHGTGAGRS